MSVTANPYQHTPTPAYHEWIASQHPVERWSLRLALAGAAYARAAEAGHDPHAPALVDARDRLLGTADAAANMRVGRLFVSLTATCPRPEQARRLYLAAVAAGECWAHLERLAETGFDPRLVTVQVAAARYGEAMDTLRAELEAARARS